MTGIGEETLKLENKEIKSEPVCREEENYEENFTLKTENNEMDFPEMLEDMNEASEDEKYLDNKKKTKDRSQGSKKRSRKRKGTKAKTDKTQDGERDLKSDQSQSIEVEEKDANTKQNICHLCGGSFTRHKSLQRHLYQQHGELAKVKIDLQLLDLTPID